MRLVDADTILDTFCDNCPNRAYCEDREQKCSAYSDTEEILKSAPTIEAEPVNHGRWKLRCYGDYPYCSNCKNEPQGKEMTLYCPNCGARMEGDSDA